MNRVLFVSELAGFGYCLGSALILVIITLLICFRQHFIRSSIINSHITFPGVWLIQSNIF